MVECEQVEVLVRISKDIQKELKRGDGIISEVEEGVDSARARLGQTMKRLQKIIDSGGSNHMCHLCIFILVFLFVVFKVFLR
jgi:hypothetical protein